MTPTPRHQAVEATFRSLLASAELPAPDEVGYEPAAVVFYWHEPKVAVLVGFESQDGEPLLERRASGSPSIKNAKGRIEMASKSTTTTDHDEIRRWVEEHQGKPASVRGTDNGDEAGVPRIDFPGGAGSDELEHISWDDWFQKFDESDLAFLYQQEKASGEDSTFFKLVSRENA